MNSLAFLKTRAPRGPQATRPRIPTLAVCRYPLAINVAIALGVAIIFLNITASYFETMAIRMCTLPGDTATIARCLQAMFRP